jgi:hypothetical protein
MSIGIDGSKRRLPVAQNRSPIRAFCDEHWRSRRRFRHEGQRTAAPVHLDGPARFHGTNPKGEAGSNSVTLA